LAELFIAEKWLMKWKSFMTYLVLIMWKVESFSEEHLVDPDLNVKFETRWRNVWPLDFKNQGNGDEPEMKKCWLKVHPNTTEAEWKDLWQSRGGEYEYSFECKDCIGLGDVEFHIRRDQLTIEQVEALGYDLTYGNKSNWAYFQGIMLPRNPKNSGINRTASIVEGLS
jgi:hypothetical protein